MRVVHPRVPAGRPHDVGGREPHGLPLAGAARGLHRLRGLPPRVPRLRLRGLPVRAARAPRVRGGIAVTTTATTHPAPRSERVLMEGSEALVQAAIAAGCRFFAGYPMTPFTEV